VLNGAAWMPVTPLGQLSDAITPPAASTGGTLRLVVVEDSDADYELLLILLRKSGYTPSGIRVETESEMRQVLASRNWDLVIADNRLPRFSAEAALRVLGDMRLDLPFIIVSGAMQEEAAIAAMLAGADDYITKARLARLVPAIERGLRAAETRRLQREASQALRENESRLRALAANVPGILFEARYEDGGLKFSFVSEGSQALLGLTPAALLQTPALLLDLIEPVDRNVLLARFDEALRMPGIIQWEGRARARGDDSELRWVQLGASPGLDAAQRLVWSGVMTDITALKRAEGELGQSRDELRSLSAHLAQIRESERTRIAREIHDDIGGLLTGLRADISWLKRRLGEDAAIGEKLRYMDELVDSAASASMRIVRDLRPAVLDFGIVAAMEWLSKDFTKHSGTACGFSCNQEELELDRERGSAVFRIFQELLTNITKHAKARKVVARMQVGSDTLTLTVHDDGLGIVLPNRRQADSFGIRGIRERAVGLGGNFSINADPDGGTTAILEIPLQLQSQ
jgi:PAS domain S-box-containing protein